MLSDRLTSPSFVLAKSSACMSVCLTHIASMTAWTCNFVDNTTSDFNWDFGLKGTYKCSNFSEGDDWDNWCFNFMQGFQKMSKNVELCRKMSKNVEKC